MVFQTLIFRKHLDEGEKVYAVIHKHWITIYSPTAKVGVFGFLIPWFLFALFPPFFWIAAAITAIAYLRLMYIIIDWYCDAWLITSSSIIILYWKGFFNHTSSRLEYSAIDSINYQITGFWGTVFNFGKLTIEKTSGSPAKMKNVKDPKGAELLILRYKEKFEDAKLMKDTEGLKDILSEMVAHELKKK